MSKINYFLFTYTFLIILSSCQSKSETKQPNFFEFRALGTDEKVALQSKTKFLFDSILGTKNFNGAVLIAKNGEIVLEDYYGYFNFATGEKLQAHHPIHLASISKTFTAAAILKLVERGQLQLTDSLEKFWPNFPYQNIQIISLLSHRSGLPNYNYFLDTAKAKQYYTNADVIDFIIQKKPALQAKPNSRFQYCNTNYALLASILEKVTGQSFPTYMKDSIFNVLGLKHSFVFSINDTAQYTPSYLSNNRPIGLTNQDCIYGDKNIYSTVRDLLVWDKALYRGNFLHPKTLEMAFTPYSNEVPSVHNYGLGWRMLINEDQKTLYHNGWWHGNNTVFIRQIQDTSTIIVLGNRYNRSIYSARSIGKVFNQNISKDEVL